MLVTNFTWWLNRKDRDGRNLFEGGFLGLDNIGVFDRSSPLPTGGYLEQADGTAWMAFYAQNMLDMALELALVDPTYEDVRDQVLRARRLDRRRDQPARRGSDSLWDEEDGFFYDVLRVPGQFTTRLKVRSIVGLLPLCAVSVYRPEVVAKLPRLHRTREVVQREPARAAREPQSARRGPGVERPLHAVDALRREAAAGAGADARSRRSSSATTASARCRASTSTTPTSSGPAARSTASATCPPSRTAGCSAATRTGAGRSGRRSTRSSSAALLQMYALLRRRLQGRVPDRLGPAHDPLPGGARSWRTAWRRSSCSTTRGAGPSTAAARSSATIRCGATTCCSTSTSTATTAPAWAPATRPGGRRCIPALTHLFAVLTAGDGPRARVTPSPSLAQASATLEAPGASP